MATLSDRLKVAEALNEIARLIESGKNSSSFTRWVERDKGAGYYVRVVLPDDVFKSGMCLVKGRSERE